MSVFDGLFFDILQIHKFAKTRNFQAICWIQMFNKEFRTGDYNSIELTLMCGLQQTLRIVTCNFDVTAVTMAYEHLEDIRGDVGNQHFRTFGFCEMIRKHCLKIQACSPKHISMSVYSVNEKSCSQLVSSGKVKLTVSSRGRQRMQHRTALDRLVAYSICLRFRLANLPRSNELFCQSSSIVQMYTSIWVGMR